MLRFYFPLFHSILIFMKKDCVPQDNNRTYGGHNKVLYAVNTAGEYEQVKSSGWETEELATLMAVEELNEQTLAAYQRVRQGLSSPLEYQMCSKRLDLLGLAQATGFFQWQIKRHFKPSIFAKLSRKTTEKYLDALGLTEAELNYIPEHPPHS